MKAKAICDGRGSEIHRRGARAVVLYAEDGELLEERAEKIEPTTPQVAEHLAIQLAMTLALEHGVTDLLIWNDSRSPVNHVNGDFKITKEHLKPIVAKTREMKAAFENCDVVWVPREKTWRPDALCREVDP